LRAPALALSRRPAEDLTPLPVEDAPRELAPLIEAVNAHLARISGLFEASRRFAADVAHQLRTPLTLLGAQAQYGLRHRDPERLRAAMEEIAAASRAAQRLCNQMLTLSRVEAAHGAIRDGVRVDLAELLRETAFDLGVLALEKQIDLAFDGAGPAPVVGDEIMLHELFSNLIDNALRYTPPGGRVRVRVALLPGLVEASVADGGPGIPPGRRAAVLQRFHRRLDRTGAAGAGLGLAIAHQIALAHGGGIDFADAPDGFVVRVHLPLRETPTPH
jgi:two-component system sensor histidine kinase TctE